MKTATRIVLGALLAVLLGVSQASAEFYVAGYGGIAFPNSQDLNVKGDAVVDSTVTTQDVTYQDVDLDTSALYGGKVGYFLDSWHYFGLEAEAYHFSPDAGSQVVQWSGNVGGVPVSGPVDLLFDQNIDVTAIALNFILRGMVGESDAFPRGRFQGYIGVGGGAFIGKLEAPALEQRVDDTSTVVGGQVLTGLKFFPIEHLSLFAEYKFMFTDQFKFDLSEGGLSASVETDLQSHILYGGIAYHF